MASGDAPGGGEARNGDVAVLPLSARIAPDGLALSPVQEAMFFHALASDAADMYIVQQRIDIEGALDPETLRRAWQAMVARHEALRTVFRWEPGSAPVQVVLPDLESEFTVVDASGEPDADDAVQSWLERDRRRRFDLSRGPLTRIAVHRVADASYVMLWSQHHLVQDGWSASVVLAELFQVYEALIAGTDPELPETRPFRDYIGWLQQQRAGTTRRFWEEALAGFVSPTRMMPQTPSEPEVYLRRSRALPAALSEELRGFARRQRVTLNSVLVGAAAVLLGRHRGTRDVAMGIVASGRPPTLVGVESMVGMFINTLVLRLPIDDDAPVGQWLADVQRRQADVLEHEHSSLPQVQAASPLGSGTALTDTLFAYWGFGGAGSSPSGSIQYRTVEGYGRTSFPFSVTVESSDPLRVGLDINGSASSGHEADRFLSQYESLLAEMVREPEPKVGELSMLTATELRWLGSVNDTGTQLPYRSVVDAIRDQAARTPHRPALESSAGVTVSYADLDDDSDRLAREFVRTGGEKPTVAIFSARSTEMVAAMLGALKAGGAFVPIDRHLPAGRVEHLINDSRADLVATDSVVRDRLPSVRVPVVRIDGELGDETGPLPDIDPSERAYVMYTSGSTGTPKGVEVGHDNLINYVWWARTRYAQGQPISFPLYTSPGFDLTITSIFVPLVTGGTVVVYDDHDPRALTVIDVFDDDRVDAVKLTPSHLALLDLRRFQDSHIHTLVVGGEDLRTEVARVPVDASDGRIAVFNEYGPTEATVGCMIHKYDPNADRGISVPIGGPIANTGVHLLDDNGNPVPEGVVGEIHVSGSGIARGYLGRPDSTAERFGTLAGAPSERSYRTGDLGRWIAPGVMEYVGRNDDQFKIRGLRIEPGEIEAALVSHPSVASAAVAVREVRPGDERLVAYVVPDHAAALTTTGLRDHLRNRLPDAMVPRHVVQVEQLPLTVNGKLDRAALPTTIGQLTTTTTHQPPRTEAERLVAVAAAELLGVDQVSIGDNFFELGGHSILAMELITRLHADTGVRISPRVVLLNTLEQAAAQLPDMGVLAEAGHGEAGVAQWRTSSAFFFGPSDEPLFAIGYAPADSRIRDRAVLLCAPIGWEYMRTHWAMRKIARSLADDGFHVLRFDYFATGDSAGESGSGSLQRWIDDIDAARRELAQIAGTDRVSLVGVRLGGTLAAHAASAGVEADRLILWDPIVAGPSYLAALENLHRQMLSERRGGPPGRAVIGDELLGFPYPERLRAELADLDLIGDPEPTVPTRILLSRPDPDVERLTGAWTRSLVVEHIPDAGGWNDLGSTQAALLPAAIPNRVREVLGEAP